MRVWGGRVGSEEGSRRVFRVGRSRDSGEGIDAGEFWTMRSRSSFMGLFSNA